MNQDTYLIKILKKVKDILAEEKQSANDKNLAKIDQLLDSVSSQEYIVRTTEKNYKNLQNFRIMLDDSVMWESRKKYFEIINQFLTNQIDGEDFCDQISALRSQNLIDAEDLEQNLNSKTDIYLSSKSINFCGVIDHLYCLGDLFEPGLPDSESSDFALSENEFRSKVQTIILPKFSNYYNID